MQRVGRAIFSAPLVIAGSARSISWNRSHSFPDALRGGQQTIGSDARIRALADTIRKISPGMVETVLIGPARDNELYEKFSNLNQLLG